MVAVMARARLLLFSKARASSSPGKCSTTPVNYTYEPLQKLLFLKVITLKY